VDELKGLLIIKENVLPHKGNRLDWKQATYGRPDFGGVYVIWWKGTGQNFYESLQNRVLHFHGPGGKPLKWEIEEKDLCTAENGFLPLYVGKNSSNIARRLGLHLKLKTARTVPKEAVNGICARMTTSCQVRDRIDRLFPNLVDTRPLVLMNLALSHCRIEGDGSFVKRFSLEDFVVGVLKTVFNVDSER
jgi:hypothetical protein